MAILPEDGTYPEGVYRIETTDPVLGGPPNESTGGGMINIPLMHLAKRTAWLKARVDTLVGAVVGASTAVAGIVRLNTATTSSSTTEAATPSAVKAAMDNANTRAFAARTISAGGLASGGGDLSADRTITVPAATNAEALAGVLNTVAMTPVRVKEAITAQGLPSAAAVAAAVADTTQIRPIATGGTGADTAAGARQNLGITATPAQINPLGAASANGLLVGENTNLAVGAVDMAASTPWVASFTAAGVTAIKTATGVDANGALWVEYTANGTGTATAALGLFLSQTPAAPAIAGGQFTGSAVMALVSGSVTAGADRGARLQVMGYTAANAYAEGAPSANVLSNLSAPTAVTYTLASGTTANVRLSAEILVRSGAVFTNAVFRFSGVQLDAGAARAAYRYLPATPAQARAALGLGAAVPAWLRADNGWEQLPSGLILQWGTASVNASSAFPIAFPVACMQAIASDNNDGTDNVVGVSFTRTNISISSTETAGIARFIALGY